jgi:hypothetical protein
VAHPHGLLFPVVLVVLDDAQRVHPEIPQPEGLRDLDGFLDGFGQGRELDLSAVLFVCGFGGGVELAAAPAVA